MMQTESESATGAVAGNTATYYVVPILTDGVSTENVLYFYQFGGKYLKVLPNDLSSHRRGCTGNQVTLQQLYVMPGSAIAGLDLDVDQIDNSVQLFAGVARTLKVETDPIPTSMYSANNGAITIPVEFGTSRGLILVFTKTPEPGMPPDQITTLIATTDPEIKGGVGSDCD